MPASWVRTRVRKFTGDSGRIRHSSDRTGSRKNLISFREQFVNPYPWMAKSEAMVHLYLEEKRVPFSWRHFDGEAIHFQYLMRDYLPEFTLRECKIVIIIIGTYQVENIPGILDKSALAVALLEQDGWKVGVLYEQEILAKGPAAAVEAVLPELRAPWVHGPPRPNPYGHPDMMEQRRRFASALSLHRKQWFQDEREGRTKGRATRGSDARRQRSGVSSRTRRRRTEGVSGGGRSV